MTTEGVEAVFLETHNWGKAAKFFQSLGFEVDFATDRASGLLRNSGGGPYIFIAEVPEDREPQVQVMLKVADADAFRADPDLDVVTPFEDTHQPGAQAWKRQRLIDLGLGVPEWLRLVPVDFETGASWWERLADAGFDASRPAVVASTGVTMYLTKDAVAATLRQVATLAPGSTLAMTFIVPAELAEPEERSQYQEVEKSARASGTPFLSFFRPPEMLALARDAGFRDAQHVSAATLTQRYFAGRADGLRPSSGEAFLVATT